MESVLQHLFASVLYIFSSPHLLMVKFLYKHTRRTRRAEGQPPKLGRNQFHLGKFSERTLGTSGNFSTYSPALFDILGRKFTAPLNLTSFYAHVYKWCNSTIPFEEDKLFSVLWLFIFPVKRLIICFQMVKLLQKYHFIPPMLICSSSVCSKHQLVAMAQNNTENFCKV